jgi:hypothetical protein
MSASAKFLTALMRTMCDLHRNPEIKDRIVVQADDDDALVWLVQFVYQPSDTTGGKEYRVECRVRFGSCLEGQPPLLGIVRPRLVAPFIHHGAICLVDFGMTRFDPVAEPEQLIMLLEELHFRLGPESVTPPTDDATYSAAEHDNGFKHIRTEHPHFARQFGYHSDDGEDDGGADATAAATTTKLPTAVQPSPTSTAAPAPPATNIIGNDWTCVADGLFEPSAAYKQSRTTEVDLNDPDSLKSFVDLLAEPSDVHAIEELLNIVVKIRTSTAPPNEPVAGSSAAPVLVIGARKRLVLCPADDDSVHDTADTAATTDDKPLLALHIQVGDGSDIAIAGFTLTGSLDFHGVNARGYAANCHLIEFSITLSGSHASCDVKCCTVSPSCSFAALRDTTLRVEDCGMIMDSECVTNADHNALAVAATFPAFFFVDGERARLAMNRCTLQSPTVQSAVIVLLNGAEGLVRATNVVTRCNTANYKSAAILMINSKLSLSESSITTGGCPALSASYESDVNIRGCQCESICPRDDKHPVSGVAVSARSKAFVADMSVRNYYYAFQVSDAAVARFVNCEATLANNGFTADESSMYLEQCRIVNARQAAVFAHNKSFVSVEDSQATTLLHGFECAKNSRMVLKHVSLHATGANTVGIFVRDHSDVKIYHVVLTCSVLPKASGLCVTDNSRCSAVDFNVSDFAYAVSLRSTACAVLTNVTIERASNGVTVHEGCEATVDNCRILDARQVGVFATGDNATVKISRSILRTATNGIECSGKAKATVDSVTIDCTGTAGSGFLCCNGGQLRVEECSVKGCGVAGTVRGASIHNDVTFYASRLTVADVHIGASAIGSCTMELTACSFTRVEQGIHATTSKANVVNCTVEGATQVGIFCNAKSQVTIDSTTISTQRHGVEVSTDSECVANDVAITNLQGSGTGFYARDKSRLIIGGTSSVRCDGQADGVNAVASTIYATGLLITSTVFAAAAQFNGELLLDRCRIEGCANGVTLTDGSSATLNCVSVEKSTSAGVYAITNSTVTLRSPKDTCGATRTRISGSRFCLETDNTGTIDCEDADLELRGIHVCNIAEACAVVFRSSQSLLKWCTIRNAEPWAKQRLEGCGVRLIQAASSISDCTISDFAVGVQIRNDGADSPLYVTAERVRATNVDDAFALSGSCECTLRECSAQTTCDTVLKAEAATGCAATPEGKEGRNDATAYSALPELLSARETLPKDQSPPSPFSFCFFLFALIVAGLAALWASLNAQPRAVR